MMTQQNFNVRRACKFSTACNPAIFSFKLSRVPQAMTNDVNTSSFSEDDSLGFYHHCCCCHFSVDHCQCTGTVPDHTCSTSDDTFVTLPLKNVTATNCSPHYNSTFKSLDLYQIVPPCLSKWLTVSKPLRRRSA